MKFDKFQKLFYIVSILTIFYNKLKNFSVYERKTDTIYSLFFSYLIYDLIINHLTKEVLMDG